MLRRGAVLLGMLSVLTAMLVGLAGAADASSSASSAAATHVVAVQDGLDAAALAASYGIEVEDVWDTAVTGFSAALSSKQVKALQKDSRVDSVTVNSQFEFAAYGEPQVIGPAVERIDGPLSPTAQINGLVLRL